MVRNINLRGAGLGAFVYLKRGDSFELDIKFEYKGKPQNATFQLNMRKALWATQFDCGSNTGAVKGAADWEPRTAKFSFIVPTEVEDGGKDIQLHITAADGEHDASDWLNECIWVS